MDWSVSTVRTSVGWQVSVSRPDLLDGDQATAVLSGLTLTTDQPADDADLNLMVAWMVPDPAIQVPVRLDGLTIQQTEQQAGLNGHQQACAGDRPAASVLRNLAARLPDPRRGLRGSS